jgi:hypothetical protein
MTDETTLNEIITSIESDAPVARNAPLPVIGASEENAQESVNTSETAETDSAGTPYDPAVHTKGKTKTKDGIWRKRPPGRPEGSGKAPTPAAKSTLGGFPEGTGPRPSPAGEGEGNAPGAAPAAPSVNYRAAAAQIVGATVGLHSMVLGEDWLAQEPEMKMLVDATEAYFVATGQSVNLPPWIGLAGAYMVYSAPRFQKPKTVNRLKAYFETVRKFWAKYRPKASPVKVEAKAGKVETPVASARRVDTHWRASEPAPI